MTGCTTLYKILRKEKSFRPLSIKGLKHIIKVPQTRIELVREYKSRRILSPVRLPVPPLRHFVCSVYNEGIRASTVPSNLLTQWAMVDSNHRRRCQQIYSLSPLATRESAHLSDTQNAL